jgi:hypothetical protein
MSRSFGSVSFLPAGGAVSPTGLPCYKLVGVPCSVAPAWADRLESLGCCGVFVGAKCSAVVVIDFWASSAAVSRLSAAFPSAPAQMSLF